MRERTREDGGAVIRLGGLAVGAAVLVAVVSLLAAEGLADAQGDAQGRGRGLFGERPAAAARAQLEGWERVRTGWDDFARWDVILDMAIILVIAVALGAAIAYHPLARGKVGSIEEFEQPKTFLMYAMVGAVIAQAVIVEEMMALVVFGIGGLLRFRTDVGQAKDTGRVILVTAVGIACGLKLFVVAILAAAFGWLLIYYLESKSAERMQVKGLEKESIAQAAEAHREILTAAGCRIIRERKNFLKGQVTFVFSVPRGLERETIEERFAELPKDQRGTVDWETA